MKYLIAFLILTFLQMFGMDSEAWLALAGAAGALLSMTLPNEKPTFRQLVQRGLGGLCMSFFGAPVAVDLLSLLLRRLYADFQPPVTLAALIWLCLGVTGSRIIAALERWAESRADKLVGKLLGRLFGANGKEKL